MTEGAQLDLHTFCKSHATPIHFGYIRRVPSTLRNVIHEMRIRLHAGPEWSRRGGWMWVHP